MRKNMVYWRMMTYEDLKIKFSEQKEKIVLGACFVLVFVVGFGSGRYVKQKASPPQLQSKYTTTSAKKPAALPAEEAATIPVVEAAATTTQTATTVKPCPVKGNISSGGKKIYHVPGGAFYARVHEEMCFQTEAEALAAGFVKSGR